MTTPEQIEELPYGAVVYAGDKRIPCMIGRTMYENGSIEDNKFVIADDFSQCFSLNLAINGMVELYLDQ